MSPFTAVDIDTVARSNPQGGGAPVARWFALSKVSREAGAPGPREYLGLGAYLGPTVGIPGTRAYLGPNPITRYTKFGRVREKQLARQQSADRRSTEPGGFPGPPRVAPGRTGGFRWAPGTLTVAPL